MRNVYLDSSSKNGIAAMFFLVAGVAVVIVTATVRNNVISADTATSVTNSAAVASSASAQEFLDVGLNEITNGPTSPITGESKIIKYKNSLISIRQAQDNGLIGKTALLVGGEYIEVGIDEFRVKSGERFTVEVLNITQPLSASFGSN